MPAASTDSSTSSSTAPSLTADSTQSGGSSASSSTMAPSSMLTSPTIPKKLDGSNYLVWRALLTPYLRASNLMSIVDGSEQAPPSTILLAYEGALPQQQVTNPAYSGWMQQDQCALGWILSSSSKSIITTLATMKTSAEARRFWPNPMRPRILHAPPPCGSNSNMSQKGTNLCLSSLIQFLQLLINLQKLGSRFQTTSTSPTSFVVLVPSTKPFRHQSPCCATARRSLAKTCMPCC